MLRRVLAGAIVVVGAGCNGLFGLEATSPESADADHDGVDDDVDNCRGVDNPGQEDRDGDTIGDECDPFPDGLICATGRPINQDVNGDGIDDGCQSCASPDGADEDGDGQPDACDRCPGLVGGQDDRDTDGVGDDCDLSEDRQSRLRFDGFNVDGVPNEALFTPTPWFVDGGLLISTPSPVTLVPALAGGATGDWSMQLGLLLPETSTDGHAIEIRVLDPAAQLEPAVCSVVYNATTKTWGGLAQACCGEANKAPFLFNRDPAGNTLRVFLVEKEGMFDVFCQIVGGGGAAVGAAIASAPVRIQLATTIESQLTYVDVVR